MAPLKEEQSCYNYRQLSAVQIIDPLKRLGILLKEHKTERKKKNTKKMQVAHHFITGLLFKKLKVMNTREGQKHLNRTEKV